MRKAHIENGRVVNMVLVDPDNIPDWCADWPEATEEADIGMDYADGKFTAPPSPPEPVPESISFAQMIIGLVAEGWIAQADGEAWLDGVLPPIVIATISLLPAEEQFVAKAKAKRPSQIERGDKLVAMMAMTQKRSSDEVDAFFRKYAKV